MLLTYYSALCWLAYSRLLPAPLLLTLWIVPVAFLVPVYAPVLALVQV